MKESDIFVTAQKTGITMGFFDDFLEAAKDVYSDLKDTATELGDKARDVSREAYSDLKYTATDLSERAIDASRDIYGDLKDTAADVGSKAKETLDDFSVKAEEVAESCAEGLKDKIEEKCAEMNPSTLKIGKGAAKVTYGIVRGGLAVSGALGHGIVGHAVRNNHMSPKVRQEAARMIGHGFEAAGDQIEEGARLVKEGLEDRKSER